MAKVNWDKEEQVFLKRLGENIAKIRKKKNIASKTVYESLEIDRSNYRRIEAGRTNPSALLLRKIARELNSSVEELFRGVE